MANRGSTRLVILDAHGNPNRQSAVVDIEAQTSTPPPPKTSPGFLASLAWTRAARAERRGRGLGREHRAALAELERQDWVPDAVLVLEADDLDHVRALRAAFVGRVRI